MTSKFEHTSFKVWIWFYHMTICPMNMILPHDTLSYEYDSATWHSVPSMLTCMPHYSKIHLFMSKSKQRQK